MKQQQMEHLSKALQQGYLVLVRCFTYNQATYIKDALNGFVMQQTTFPYIVAVVDDASTDGEQEVIHKYLEENFDLRDDSVAYTEETDYAHIIYAKHKSNNNCYIVVLFLKENHYSQKKAKSVYLKEWSDKVKYHALCEGDDYWVDSLKLQKQADFMENHPSHSLCFHAHIVHDRLGTDSIIRMYNQNMDFCSVDNLILGDADGIATNSMFFRKELTDKPQWAKKLSFGDFSLELILAERGYVGYLDEIMSCYRLNSLESWTSRNKSIEKQINNRKERIKMWKEYNKWSNYKYKKAVCRMLFYDRCRLFSLRYLSYFNLNESCLISFMRYIYYKLK